MRLNWGCKPIFSVYYNSNLNILLTQLGDSVVQSATEDIPRKNTNQDEILI